MKKVATIHNYVIQYLISHIGLEIEIHKIPYKNMYFQPNLLF